MILGLSTCTGEEDPLSVENQSVFVDSGDTNLEIASGIIVPFTLN